MISFAIFYFFKLIYLIIIIAVLLSWVPIFDEKKEPIATIYKIYNAILAPFKAVIPPIGMIDITPIAAFILLQFVEHALIRILSSFGL